MPYSQEVERMEQTSARMEAEATEVFDDLITVFVLIGESSRSKRDKKLLIKKQSAKVTKWVETSGNDFVKVYNRYVKKGYKDADKRAKQLTTGQAKELTILRDEYVADLRGKLSYYERQAVQLVNINELEKIRETEMGYDDAVDKTVVNRTRLKKNIVLMDSKGRRVTTKHVMSITVGDAIWNAMISARKSAWIISGRYKARLIAVIDSGTTPYCRSINQTIIDIRKDPTPPFHVKCRTVAELI